MEWSGIGQLVAQAAPTIGSILGGLIPFPGGAVLGQVAGKILAEALGVAPTPIAIANAIQTGDPATVQAALSEAEVRMTTEVDKYKAQLADVEDARHVGLEYAKSDSKIQWAPSVVSVIAVAGFCLFSYMAIIRPVGADRDVLMYLLGIWSGAFLTVLNFWLGTSASSQGKSDQLAAIASGAASTQTAKKK
jgi:hypothetical protein